VSPHLQAGFADPVTQSQAVFKAAMWALAEPAKALPAPVRLDAPRPLGPVAAALLLALADFETGIWLDPQLAAAPDVSTYLRFHTGARITDDPAAAQFAAIADPAAMPSFPTFAQGTSEYPDRSTTLILQVESLASGVPLVLEGPGIQGVRSIAPAPLPADFAARLTANRARFPQGIDLLLVTETEIAGLPRSLRVRSN
jgi:alpha-D-ribose 1-methylphosphonate 5-triphosphate synthase subunit PhnH